jgi:hypothetical protein
LSARLDRSSPFSSVSVIFLILILSSLGLLIHA